MKRPSKREERRRWKRRNFEHRRQFVDGAPVRLFPFITTKK
jgi:hypothetical protein